MRDRRRQRLTIVLLAVVAVGAVAVAAVLGLGLGRVPTPTVAGPAPRFADETATAGVDYAYDGAFQAAFGGGLATFDCNDDGRPELYVAGGDGPAVLFVNRSTPGGPLRFERLAAGTTDLEGVNGAYPIDVDSDGQTDLIVLRNGEDVALRGLGGCRFERANEAWKLTDPVPDSMTEAFSATWERGRSWPTLAFGNYVDFGVADAARGCQANTLLRPAGAGPGYGTPVELTPGWCALSMLFSDWDGSGRSDLRVSNDRHYYPAADGEEQLWRMEPNAAPRLYTGDEGWVRVQLQGMGIGTYDLTGDGLPEVYLTSQGDQKLQTLSAGAAQPKYADIGFKRGVNVASAFAGDVGMASTGWHPQFEDVNDDGFVDLFVSKGNVSKELGFAQRDPSNLLLGSPDGAFREAADTAGIMNFDRARGAALADLDLDGRLDLVIVNYGAPVRVWRNLGPGGAAAPGAVAPGASGAGNAPRAAHWLGVRVREPAPNVDAIGGWLEVRVGEQVQRRELTIGGGHASGSLGPVHLGLGPAQSAEVRVRWPGGEVGPWLHVEADRYVTVERGSTTAVPWVPSPAP